MRTIQGESVSVTVTIEAIDQSARILTVKDSAGVYEMIQVPAEMPRFAELKVGDRIKVGDQLDMTWTDALLISVEPATSRVIHPTGGVPALGDDRGS